MPIINFEDYYKPKAPPKAPSRYYQPPKPKPTPPPMYTDYSQGRYGSAYAPPPKDIRDSSFAADMADTRSGIGAAVRGVGTSINNAYNAHTYFWSTIFQNLNRNAPATSYPLDGTTAAAPPTFNTSREPPRGAFGVTQSPNITDRAAWQQSLQNWWTPPSVVNPPRDASYMPNYPANPVSNPYGVNETVRTRTAPYTGANPGWTLPTNAGLAAYQANINSPWVSGTRMGGTSLVFGYADTGGIGAPHNGAVTPPNRAAMPPAGKYGRGQFPQILNPDSWLVASQNPGSSYRRETLAELLARGAVDPWGFDPYEIGGSPYQVETEEPIYEDDGGYGWGSGWGSGGGSSYGASSGVNSYLPGTRAGYGASASSPRYNGYGGARGSSYAGGQYNNQAAWRMPMLVWNI